MKPIKILIFLSLFFGFSSLFSQVTNTETKKSEPEKNTAQVTTEIKRANQTPVVKTGEQIPATTREARLSDRKMGSKEDNGVPPVKTAASDPDPLSQTTKSKSATKPQPESKPKTQVTQANTDPKKLN